MMINNKDDMQPKISVVVTARNDDHGGGFLRRMQIFTNGLIAQCDRHRLRAELIVVEWNTMHGRPGLSEVLSWPDKSEYCSVRFIEVPPEVHKRYKYSASLGLYQMIAKNVAFRRARADFLLATNIDILISDDLVKFMASEELREKILYRVDRYDIPEDIPLEASIEEQLEYCRRNLTRNNQRDGTRNFMTGKYFPTYVGLYTDSTRLHFNACGDFTLMSKNDWHDLRGYPEFDMYSAHIDSVMLLMAYNAGIRQEILPDSMQTYHIEHSSSMIAEKANKLFRDLDSAGVPQIKVPQLEEWACEMNRNGHPILFNGPDWGLVSDELKETFVIRADWDKDVPDGRKINCLNKTNGNVISPDHLTVIITGNGEVSSLEKCLDSLSAQVLPASEFDVLIITGGGTEQEKTLDKYTGKINIRTVKPELEGLSAAYAAGVRQSKGNVLLFLKSDSIADRNLLYEHWAFHKNNLPDRKGIWAHLDMQENVMVGRRSWDDNLARTPLMDYGMKVYKKLKSGDTLDWRYFRCDNLSCSRDFIIRYGNFDETFNEYGDMELGYRLSRHSPQMIYNSKAKSYSTAPLTPEKLKDDSSAEGRFAFMFNMKHPDPEVQKWCRVNGAEIRSGEIEDRMPEYLKRIHNSSEMTPGLSDCFDMIREYYRSKGLIAASKDKTQTIKKILTGRLCEKAGKAGGKAILIISEHLPFYDMYPEDNALYQLIKALARDNSISFLARKGVEKGKYIECLRRIGVSVFYDSEGLKEQAMLEPKMFCHASSVVLPDMLTHCNYDIVLINTAGTGTLYLDPVRDLSPQSVVMISTFASNLTPEHIGMDKIYVYEEADVVVAYSSAAETLLNKMPHLNIKLLPEASDSDGFNKDLSRIVHDLPMPADKKSERFRILPGSLPDIIKGFKKTGVTVIFVMTGKNDISGLSLDALIKYSDPESSNIIVALNNKRRNDADRKLEREEIPYFIYDNDSERDKFIAGVIGHCQSVYAAVIEDSVMVSPQWDRRLTDHLERGPGIGIITARHSEFIYNSVYELEKDAYAVYEQNMGECMPSGKIDVPCLILRPALLSKKGHQDLKAIFRDWLAAHKTAAARDTLVFHLRKGLKDKDRVTIKMTPDKKISVIVPSIKSGGGLPACLNSLFIQKDIDYGDIEIIAVCAGSGRETIDVLSRMEAPCDFKYLMHDGGLSSALNRGIMEASGEYILFVTEDAVAHEDLISEHLKTHVKYAGKDIAVLGHITVSGMDDSSPFRKFLLKNPKLPFASPLVYNYSDISNPENAGHFYLPNISLNRRLFNEIGMFDEELQDGWESMEFGSRFTLKGHRVVYSRKPVVSCSPEIDFAAFIDRQVSVGRQYAIMAYMHPNLWYPDKAKKECLHNLIGKEQIFENALEIARTLEGMPEDILNNYRYAGMSLLDKYYSNLLNYYFARGINDVISRLEGEGWFSRYAERNDINIDGMINKNRAYELLLESYWHSGRGEHALFSKCIEQSSGLLDAHPSPYYAVGNFYFNQNEYALAEATFEKGIEKRRYYDDDYIFPAEDESLYIMWLAMACIPQGKYKKAAEALEQLIAERVTLSAEQEAMLYKCLSLCYKALDKTKKAVFCRHEAERLYEDIKATAELSRV